MKANEQFYHFIRFIDSDLRDGFFIHAARDIRALMRLEANENARMDIHELNANIESEFLYGLSCHINAHMRKHNKTFIKGEAHELSILIKIGLRSFGHRAAEYMRKANNPDTIHRCFQDYHSSSDQKKSTPSVRWKKLRSPKALFMNLLSKLGLR